MEISINSLLHGIYNKVDNIQGLVIFVHGITSSQDEPIIEQGTVYFNQKGYSTFRFNLYGSQSNEKKLIDSSLSENITDINNVIRYFVELGEENIIIIGHSFGGLALLYSDLSHVAKIVLWDASIGGEELLSDVYSDQQGYYIDRGDHYKHYISQTMYQDFLTNPSKRINQIKKIEIPIAIIAAEHGLKIPAQRYADAIGTKAIIIKGADHIFSSDLHKNQLFEVTSEWL